jgi:phosphatidylethanolamine N-methyltransferase
MLILLQCWTSFSIYESLGEYGWFFGDFFYTRPAQRLTYSGIYRYLNNPERLFGIAGVWGVSLLCNSTAVTVLAFFWTFGTMAFIQLVEQPHMQKLYGGKIRREAGVTKTIRQATKLAPPLESRVKQLQGSFDKVIGETATAVETFLNQAKPKLQGGVKGVVEETKVLLRQYPARMTIVRVAEDVNVNTALYSLAILTEPQDVEDKRGLVFNYGSPLIVKWTADENHSKKDWIGLYRITDNISREVTTVSSSGRWTAIDPAGYKDHKDGVLKYEATTGEVRFCASTLFWEKGIYEFRYHHGGKHNVLAISQPFEINIQKQEIGTDVKLLAESILSLIRVCCDGTLQAPPDSIDDLYDLHDNTVLQRVTYGIETIYGVELAPAVVRSDRNALSLATRLVSVKEALHPFVKKTDF